MTIDTDNDMSTVWDDLFAQSLVTKLPFIQQQTIDEQTETADDNNDDNRQQTQNNSRR